MAKVQEAGKFRFGQDTDAFGTDAATQIFDLYYDAASVPYFAWWKGNVIKFTYENDDVQDGRKMFLEHLRMISMSPNDALHTIAFYNSVGENGINISTQYSKSFNFRILGRFENSKKEHIEAYTPPATVGSVQNDRIAEILEKMALMMQQQNEKIQALEDKINEEDEYEDEEIEEEEIDPNERVIVQIKELIDKVDRSEKIGGIVDDARFAFRSLMKRWNLWDNTVAPHAAGVTTTTSTNKYNMDINNLTEEQKNQLNQAIGIVAGNWKNFANAMMKLADMAQNKKEDFDYIIRKLDKGLNDL